MMGLRLPLAERSCLAPLSRGGGWQAPEGGGLLASNFAPCLDPSCGALLLGA